MSFFVPSELNEMRSEIANTLPDTCAILSVTMVGDGFGGVTETWGTATASVACRMDHKRGVEAVTGGAVTAYQGNMLSLPYSTTITTKNRVVYGGGTYAVKSVSEGSALLVKRVEVERI